MKPSLIINIITISLVAPYVGAWIETGVQREWHTRQIVAPYVGAWIETNVDVCLWLCT